MRIWLVTVGEPLPIRDRADRLYRAGIVAEILSGRGHEVLWWTSAVDHNRKEFFVCGEPRVQSRVGASIQFLSGRLYQRNVSLARVLNHIEIGRRFRELAPREPQPDIILCSFPTIELSRECVSYGMSRNIPVVLDVRDLWPDIFLGVLPQYARRLARVALQMPFRDSARALSACDCLFAVSDGYLEWALSRAGRQRRMEDRTYPLGYPKLRWSGADSDSLAERLRSHGVDQTRPLVTFVGTFGRTYDLETLIRAADLLRRGGREGAQVVLCGTGEREADWREAAAGISGIAFPGWLPAGELACLLSRSTIGVAAYATAAPQGIPNKVIEYLSAGLPVLCSLDGEARELLEAHKCGIYYAPGDARGLATYLEGLLANPGRRLGMAVAARGLFEQRFSAQAVYGGMADHLESLAMRRNMRVREQSQGWPYLTRVPDGQS
jgi:glycosyltransferase involved in cell wall biosynthesis